MKHVIRLNHSIMHLYILLILLPVILGQIFTKNKVNYARRLTGHTIKTIISVSADKCHKECRRRADCLSLNYNHRQTMCELNNHMITGTNNLDRYLKEHSGWINMNMEPVLQDVLGFCSGNTCTKSYVCRNGHCVVERCNPIMDIFVANGDVLGNMNDMGSRIRIVCETGYTLIGDDVSKCLLDGNWSSLPSCEKPCPVPMELQNTEGYPAIVSANINTPDGLLTNVILINANTVVLENSEVTFDCSGGMYLQFPQKIFCRDGQWVYMPGCKEMGLGIDCVVDASCSIQPQSNECVNRICRCPLGTSYSYSESRCIEKCHNGYADTFNEVKYKALSGHNIEEFSGTEEECEDACVSRTTYTCRSFDFFYQSPTKCTLQSATYYDYPSYVRDWSGGSYYLRDCL